MPGEDAAEELDQLIRRVDPDRWLASRFIADRGARTDVLALYAFDHELARATKAASTSLLAEIRLTWWREALDEMFAGRPVRRHPVAEALANAVRRHGLPREPLEAMIDGQIAVLEVEPLDAVAAIAWADAVEGSLAGLAALVLDPAAGSQLAAPAGRAWGLALLHRSGRASDEVLRGPLRRSLADAREAARRLSIAALPAALPAALARLDLSAHARGPLRKRLALVLAAASGRV